MGRRLDQPDPEVGIHRVALELKVDENKDRLEPEEWDLRDLAFALRTGLAMPLRTIRGLVVDSERDRLSTTLESLADDVDQAVQLHWLVTASPSPVIARPLRAPRPTLEILIELEHLSAQARRLARRLDQREL